MINPARTPRAPFGKFKKHFFAGLLVVIPLAVATWLVLWILSLLWSMHQVLPAELQPEILFREHRELAQFLNFLFTVGMAFTLVFAISILGWASRQYVGRKILQLIALVIQHIPVIRSIYSGLDQLLKAVAHGGGQQFSRVVYVEWPRKGLWALGFVTGPAHGPGVPPEHLNVFVPATPNPTAGFHFLIHESEVRETHLTVEQAFKVLLSLGIAQPDAVAAPKP